MKRFVCIFLVLCVLAGVMAVQFATPAGAEITDIPSYSVYRAEYYAKNFSDIFGDAESSFASNYYQLLKDDTELQASIVLWESTHIVLDISHATESGMLRKKDMYTLAIYDLLDHENENSLGANIFKSYTDNFDSNVYSLVDYICDDETGLLASELKGTALSEASKAKIKKWAEVNKVLDTTDQIFSMCANTWEAVNTISMYAAISKMGDSVYAVLDAIATDSSAPSELRNAAIDCQSFYQDAYGDISNQLLSGGKVVTEWVFKTAIDSVKSAAWNKLVVGFPVASAGLLVAQGLRALGNEQFNLDDRNRLYYQIGAMVELEDSLRRVMNTFGSDFLAEGNDANGEAYMQAVDMYKQAVLFGYDYSMELVATDESEEAQTVIEQIAALKASAQNNYARFDDLAYDNYKIEYQLSDSDPVEDFYNQTVSLGYEIVNEATVTITGYSGQSNALSIPRTIEGLPVTTIASNAFAGSTHLRSVTVPDSVTSIGYGAFSGCSGLEVMQLPFVGYSASGGQFGVIFGSTEYEGSTTVTQYESAYYFRTYYIPSGLKSVTVTGGVMKYGAFYNCSMLENIRLSGSMTMFDQKVFYNCSDLKSVEIPATVTHISYGAFEGCTSLEAVYISDMAAWCGVTYSDQYASPLYIGASKLYLNGIEVVDLVIPEGVTKLGSYAFYNCKGIKSVTIPNTVTSIAGNAFTNCSGLSSVEVPDSVTSIGGGAFAGCSGLEVMRLPFVGYLTSGGHFGTLFGTTAYEGGTVVTQYESAYFPRTYCIPSGLKSVTVTGGLITYGAFHNCSMLEEIYIPGSVTSIGQRAFENCSNLRHMPIPPAVTSIESDAFKGCTSLKDMYIYDVAAWCNMSFGNNASNPMCVSGERIFLDGQELVDLVIPEGVTTLKSYVFYNCKNIRSVTIPDTVTSIAGNAFTNCSGLSSVEVPDSVTSIDGGAFAGCSGLEVMRLPFVGYLTSGGHFGTLFGTTAYEGGTVVTQYESAYFPRTYCIPSGLKSVTVTGGNISYGAFHNCSMLEEIHITGSITSIGQRAFENCTGLRTVTFTGDVPSFNSNSFNAVTATAYYPADNETWTSNVMQNYGGTITWKVFCEHVWMDATCTAPKTCTACGETEGEALGHTEVIDAATVPTCTTAGLTEGSHCQVCGEVLVAQEEDPALGHTEVTDAAVAPTCTETGLTEGKHCEVCGETVIAQEEVPATGHTYEKGVCTVCGEADLAAMDVNGDGKVSVFDAQLLLEAEKGLRTLTDEQQAAIGDLTAQDIVDYILGKE